MYTSGESEKVILHGSTQSASVLCFSVHIVSSPFLHFYLQPLWLVFDDFIFFQALVTNPTFMMTTIAATFDAVLITGFSNFGPKYLENQFSISASLSGIIFGKGIIFCEVMIFLKIIVFAKGTMFVWEGDSIICIW